MKPRLLLNPARFALATVLAAMAQTAPASTLTYETADEFSAAGDFNGDGRTDVLILDRTSGLYRIGYQNSSNDFVFADARPGGVAGVTSMAVGKLNGTATDSLAVTTPAANSISVLTPVTTGYTEPLQISAAGSGPSQLVALDIPGGAAPTAEDDLGLLFLTDPATAVTHRSLRSNAGTWTVLNTADAPDGNPTRANPLPPQKGSTPLFAWVEGGATATFRAFALTGGAPVSTLTLTGLPAGVQWTAGSFTGVRNDVLFYLPGTKDLSIRPIMASGPGWAFSAPIAYTFPEKIRQLTAVTHATLGGMIVAWLESGTVVSVPFNGTTFGALTTVPVPAPGETSGLLPLGAQGFLTLTNNGSSPGTTGVQRITPTPTGWAAGAAFPLPALNRYDANANAWLLDNGLFRAGTVPLIRSYRAGDWSSQVAVGGGAHPVTANISSFVDSLTGLGAASSITLGNVSTAPGGTAGNQLHAQFSIHSFSSTLGAAVLDVGISPLPGTYSNAIHIQFSGMPAGSSVYYRTTSGGAYTQTTTGEGPWLFSDTTVQYYAATSTGTLSPAKAADYRFDTPPALQDADNDGVPDFVELANGLDPAGGADSDGDGFSDADELASGTDPDDSGDAPSSISPSSIIVVEATAILPTANGTTLGLPAAGSPATLTGATGLTFARRETGDGSATAGLRFTRLSGNAADFSESFLTVSMERFPLANPGASPEFTGVVSVPLMLGTIPLPDYESWSLGTGPVPWSWGETNYQSGSGTWSAGTVGGTGASDALLDPRWGSATSGTWSASAWVAAWLPDPATIIRPTATAGISPRSTLSTLLLRAILEDVSAARGGSSALTFTPERLEDLAAGRQALTAGQTWAFRRPSEDFPSAPSIRLADVVAYLDSAMDASTPKILALQKFARELYLTFSHANPPVASLGSPVDFLGGPFMDGSTLDLAAVIAAAGSTLTTTQLQEARTALTTIREGYPRRAAQAGTLTIPATASPPGLFLAEDSSGTTWALIGDDARTFTLGSGLELAPGQTILITGYADIPDIGGYPGLEVLTAQLGNLPAPTGDDTDNDLLADEWELYHFGSLANTGTDSRDGSAYTLAQEYFEGTDPTAASSSPPVPPTPLVLTDLRFLPTGTPGQLCLCVRWPERYADVVEIGYDAGTDLASFSALTGLAVHNGSGVFIRTLSPSLDRQFFRPFVRMRY